MRTSTPSHSARRVARRSSPGPPSPPRMSRMLSRTPSPSYCRKEYAMLLPLEGRRLYYDLTGPENGPVVCMTHSLMADSGMWSEQILTLLQAGYRVLRLDMRGHGGSDPGAGGDYTM